MLYLFIFVGSVVLSFTTCKDVVAWFKDYKFLQQHKPNMIVGQVTIEYGIYLNPVIVHTDKHVLHLKGALLLKGLMVGDTCKAKISYLPHSKVISCFSIKS